VIAAVADTHAALWYVWKSERLSETARLFMDTAAAAGNTIAASSISLAEILYLTEKSRLPTPVYRRMIANFGLLPSRRSGSARSRYTGPVQTARPAPRHPAASPVEQFFQYSLLGLVASAFCALADTGRLDLASLAFLLGGIVWRILMVAGIIRLRIPQKLITVLASSYLIFYPIDFYFLSHDFFAATAHGVCFLGVARILSARSERDYLYTGTLAFVALIGAAALSTQVRFFFWLALAILFGLGALTSAEIRRGFLRSSRAAGTVGPRSNRRTARSLAFMVACSACGILFLTAGLFFLVPRTARAASLLFPNGARLTGFTNSIDLGRFGAIARDDRPILHIRSYGKRLPADLKWRGSALSRFDGRRWSEPPAGSDLIQSQGTLYPVADRWQRSRVDGERMLYRVDVSNSGAGTLFVAGVPEFFNLDAPGVIRTAEDSYRATTLPGAPIVYEVSALRGAPLPYPLSPADRRRDLALPALDRRIAALGREWTAGDPNHSDYSRAVHIEQQLQHGFVYSLDTASEAPGRDPLADFLFVTKRGYCEYFASAMAVLLRTQGIPARVATGFQSGYFNDISNTWVVRASDAHAWVEAWIEGRGWVTFDPTPPGSGDAAGGWLGSKLRRLSMYIDAVDTAWQHWVVAYNPGQQAELAFGFRNKLRNLGSGESNISWPRVVLPKLGYGLAWILLAVGALYLLRRFGPRLRREWQARTRIRKIRSGQGTPNDAAVVYEQMLESLARRGFEKPAWFTPLEFARTLPPGERERIGNFTAAYNEVRFGGDTAGAARLTSMLESMSAR
jgi:transglutaminase-like putative cysteine protease